MSLQVNAGSDSPAATFSRRGWPVALSVALLVTCLALLPKSFAPADAPRHIGVAIPVFAPSTWMVALAIALALVLLIERRRRRLALLMLPFLALAAYIGLGMIVRGGVSTRELVGAVQYLSAPVAYAVGCLLTTRRAAVEALRLTSAVAMLAQFGCASLQRIGVPLNPMGTAEAARYLGDRANGTLNHPNNLAKAIVLLLAIYYLTTGPDTRIGLRRFQLPAVVGRYGIPALALATVALTGSRTGLLATLVLLVAGELRQRRGEKAGASTAQKSRQTLTGLVLLGIAVVAIAPVFIARMIADPSGGSRSQVLRSALDFLGSNPWWGIGANSYIEVVGRVDPLVAGGLPVHNGFLFAAVELGIPGAIILFAPIIGLAALCVRQGVFQPARTSAFCLAFALAYAGIAVTTYGVVAESMLPLWFFALGVATARLIYGNQGEAHRREEPTDGHEMGWHRRHAGSGVRAGAVLQRLNMRGVVGGASAIAAARIGGSGLQAVAMVVLARHVDPHGFGVFGGYFGAVAFLTIVADAGVSTGLLRWRALGRGAAVGAGLRLNLLTTVGGLVVASAAGLSLTAGTMAAWIAVFLAVGWMVDKNVETVLSVLVADGRIGHSVVSILGRRLVQVAIFVAAVGLGGEPFASLTAGLLSASVLGQIHVRCALGRAGRASWPDVWRALLDSRAYLVSNVSAQARVLDATVVSLIVPGTGAGLYAAASRIFSPFVAIPSALSAVLVPRSARAQAGEARRLFWRMNAAVLAAVGAVCAVGIIMAPWLAQVLFGGEYSGAGTVMAVMLLGVPSFCASSPCGAVLQGAGRGGLVAKIGVVSAVALLVSVAGGAALFGPVGAAGAVTLTFVLKHVSLLAAGDASLRDDRVGPVVPKAAASHSTSAA